MGRFIADQNKVGFFYESGTYGSASGAMQWIGLVTDNSIDDEENIEQVRYTGTGTRNVDQHVRGVFDTGGTVTYHPQDFRMLGFALGSIVDSGTGPYTHTLKETNTSDGNQFTSGTYCPFISFGIEDSQGGYTAGSNFKRTLNGCMVNSWEISMPETGLMECTLEYFAQQNTFSSGASSSVTENTTIPFVADMRKVHMPSGTVLEAVKDLTISINNNLERAHYSNGSRVSQAPIPMSREYEISLMQHGLSQRTKEHYSALYRGGSEFNMMVEVEDLSAGAGSRVAFMVFSGCRITAFDAGTPNEGADEQDLTIVPKTMSVQAIDTIASYQAF